MFGSSKNSNGTGPSAPARTGIERAKTERVPEQAATTIEDLVLEPMTEQAAMKAAVAKNGFSFPEKPKPKPGPVSNESAAHLYVGANIRLKGEIAGCDMMRIEGTFEGTAQARQLILCPGGNFLGTAVIDDAEVEGTFEGTLQVRGRLFLRNKGRIRGVFSYGQLEIERGGTVEGKIVPFEPKPAALAETRPGDLAKPGLTAPAVLPSAPPRPIPAQAVRSATVQPMLQPAPKPVSGLNGAHAVNPE